ncbi:MAG: hypothetical protein BWY86_01426 [Candidatus Aminicenantes bacterium ADurb.Bin508]|nr:MAG: hypothetical protein BWY86_01426 [Candidatus Aminicenantes bacterium ADurb.Bin508]
MEEELEVEGRLLIAAREETCKNDQGLPVPQRGFDEGVLPLLRNRGDRLLEDETFIPDVEVEGISDLLSRQGGHYGPLDVGRCHLLCDKLPHLREGDLSHPGAVGALPVRVSLPEEKALPMELKQLPPISPGPLPPPGQLPLLLLHNGGGQCRGRENRGEEAKDPLRLVRGDRDRQGHPLRIRLHLDFGPGVLKSLTDAPL